MSPVRQRLRSEFVRLVACCLFVTCVTGLHAQTSSAAAWNQKAAAAYLDGRSEWWMSWPSAARDHGTFCVSCHTAVPYALSRQALRGALGEHGPAPLEDSLIKNVASRVKMWADVEPFYKDGKSGPNKSAESRGTEAVLNALILSTYASPEAKLALTNMWAQQYRTGDTKGSFPWLEFKNRPWEADDSTYYGASLAAIAAGRASHPELGPEMRDNVQELKEYLQREFERQSPVNKAVALWASAELPGSLTPEQKQETMKQLWAAQQADGGWSLTSLAGDWKRRDGTPLETRSDGYATGLVSFVLQKSGVSRDRKELKRALGWLVDNQNAAEGSWTAYSLNKNRVLTTDVGRFMSDAATGYAVLALTGAN